MSSKSDHFQDFVINLSIDFFFICYSPLLGLKIKLLAFKHLFLIENVENKNE